MFWKALTSTGVHNFDVAWAIPETCAFKVHYKIQGCKFVPNVPKTDNKVITHQANLIKGSGDQCDQKKIVKCL